MPFAETLAGFNWGMRGVLEAARAVPGFAADQVIGLSVDTTALTPISVNAGGVPLELLPEHGGICAAGHKALVRLRRTKP